MVAEKSIRVTRDEQVSEDMEGENSQSVRCCLSRIRN